MSDILDLFITRIYRTALNNYDIKINSDELIINHFLHELYDQDNNVEIKNKLTIQQHIKAIES